MKRAAVYCRISADREGAGLGVARQEKDCRALADTLSLDVVDVYTDNDISAFDRRKTRPAYLRLLEDVRAGRVDVVLAWHTDRLHRSPRELEDWIDACEQGGVTVHTVKAGPLDLATPSGRMAARMFGSVARYESEHKRDRILRKALELADAGKLGNGGPRPFGYQDDRKTVEPREADILRRCYADVLAGRPLRAICRDLHEQGITTSTGGPWSAQGLRYTLLRARNMGWRSHHGRLAAKAEWEAIVDEDTWHQVQAVLKDPGRQGAGQVRARKYLLTGVLCCGRCGRKLRPVRGLRDDQQRFACRPEIGQPKCPGGCSVVYAPLEAAVADLIFARLERDADLQPDTPADPTEEYRRSIGEQEARLEALADAYADEDGDLLEFRRAGQKIRQRITDLRQLIQQAAVEQQIADPVEVRRAWPGYDLEQRRAVVATLIERITVAPAKRGLNRFDPSRLDVTWR